MATATMNHGPLSPSWLSKRGKKVCEGPCFHGKDCLRSCWDSGWEMRHCKANHCLGKCCLYSITNSVTARLKTSHLSREKPHVGSEVEVRVGLPKASRVTYSKHTPQVLSHLGDDKDLNLSYFLKTTYLGGHLLHQEQGCRGLPVTYTGCHLPRQGLCGPLNKALRGEPGGQQPQRRLQRGGVSPHSQG